MTLKSKFGTVSVPSKSKTTPRSGRREHVDRLRAAIMSSFERIRAQRVILVANAANARPATYQKQAHF